jgi:hypothetical protein
MSSSSSTALAAVKPAPAGGALRVLLGLALLTALAVMVHGYHLGADDAAIYVPAIKKVADPGLYPFGDEFFMTHARLSWFADLVGNSAKLSRLPVDFVIFVWHIAGIFLLLLASWKLLCACFRNERARWAGVALLAALLSVPVAGTALAIMDPYLTARSLSTPATIFAIAAYVSKRPRQALAWLLATALIHPQMSVYGAVFLGCLAWAGRRLRGGADNPPVFGLLALWGLPFLFEFQPARGAAREALFSRTYFFVSNWTWYEWTGIFAPLALLWWFSSVTPKGTTPAFRSLARALVPFGLVFTAAGVALTVSARLENYTRLQPMRSFHLVYVVFFVLLGGLIGEYALQSKVWRWLGLFVPLAASMWFLQQSSYPASPHVEWPGWDYRNPWTSAFLWIRGHTPKGAVFGLDPNYMLLSGEDQHGFRAVAERSVLADNVKDSGAVSLFPQLASQWKDQVQAQSGWENFRLADFENLAKQYPVTWILTRRPGPQGLTCPYQNPELVVCRIEAGAAGWQRGEIRATVEPRPEARPPR